MSDELDTAVEKVAQALYGGDDWDRVWQDNAEFSDAQHEDYRNKARRAIRAYRACTTDTRLLNILARSSNVVEISWSVPQQEPGSLLDTLLVAIAALGEAIAPPRPRNGQTP